MPRTLSASRLNDFLGCRHRAALWLADVEPPAADDPALELLRRKGFEHEAAVLARLEAEHGPAVRIPTWAPMEVRLAATRTALSDGARLIYQATLAIDGWIGFPDFLVRTGRSTDGRWLYEPRDAKLARDTKAEHLIQLNLYAALVESVTGAPIAGGAIHVGGGGAPQHFDLRQTRHITRRLMTSFSAFAALEARETAAVKSQACAQCNFAARCQAEWRAADSPVFIAGITGAQIIKYAQGGAATFNAIAALDPGSPVGKVGSEAHAKIVRQARLQKCAERGEDPLVELLPLEARHGFALLPAPARGDLFFDMEGDPLLPDGLEYLFGLYGPLGTDGEDRFLPIWAHDAAAEKAAFERLMTLFADHLARYPTARIYHYAAYEPLALKRLAQRYATMEAPLDQMLRDHRFVDLYRVVRQALRASTEGYSLKDLETIYWRKRVGEVTSAGDSIVEYERWRETGEQAILDSIGRYNEDDCVSTARMRDWLEELRPAGANYDMETVVQDSGEADERAIEREAFQARRVALAERIMAAALGDDASRALMAELLWFHQRTQKPVWWAIFDRQTWTTEELIDDVESLGGLTLVGQVPDKRSFEATWRFEPQDTRLKVGASPRIAATLEPAGVIVRLSAEDGTVVLRRGVKKGDFPAICSLTPGAPIDQKVLVNAVIALIERLARDPNSAPAWLDFLARRAPRLRGRTAGAVVAEGEDLVAGVVRAVRDLEHGALIIQGPPGTGKTYTTARAIVALLQDGKRVAVSSNSHKAIHNVLTAVEKHARETGFAFSGAKKASSGNAETLFDGESIENVTTSGEVGSRHQLAAGTAFHFATEPADAYDYLFVDEAGQVAVGNLAAMAGCARNLVLVGDQMQLPQPIQGVHPGESGLSCLDYAMAGHATVPPDRGILLNVTRRMHPDLCAFISEAIYDGRLSAHPVTATRRLLIEAGAHPALTGTGLQVIELDHEGCTQRSVEESEVVRDLVLDLLKQGFADGSASRPLTLEDIVVVSPFNMQVDLLKSRLPPGARVGTVDKFQGQEAPVVIVSMATSFGGDAPRGAAFLFNRNRLNVAISRAECLAIIVHGRRLPDVPTPARDDLPRLDLLVAAGMEEEGRGAAASFKRWRRNFNRPGLPARYYPSSR